MAWVSMVALRVKQHFTAPKDISDYEKGGTALLVCDLEGTQVNSGITQRVKVGWC